MKSLRLAAMFLTRVPLPSIQGRVPPVAAAVPWFPTVGLAIGACTGAAYLGARELFGVAVAAGLAVAIGAAITGAFHIDGLGDTADAFGGGTTKDRRLEIMKDSRLGTYGVTAVVLAIVLQVAALSSLDAAQGFAGLLVAHSLGRSAALWVMVGMSPARRDGLGVDYLDDLPIGRTLIGSAVGVAASLVAFGPWGGLMVAAVSIGAMAVAALSQRKIGGVSGDVLGAAEQVAEVAVLLTVLALALRVDDFPWWG